MEIIPGETLIVGQDFNVNKMATVVYVERYGEDGLAELHAVDERHNGIDTPDVIAWLVEKYQNAGNGYIHPIEIYPMRPVATPAARTQACQTCPCS